MTSRYGAREPHVDIQEITTESLSFTLSGTDTSLANALRRVMISEVPTLAIDIVEISANSSVCHDEFIAHRLGLIPLISTIAGTYVYTRDCKCEGSCDNCSVNFEICVKNPIDSDTDLDVTTHDLHQTTGSGEVKPVDHYENPDKVIIVRLGPGQELTLTAVARKGIGKEHSKWSPVAVATFQYDPEIKINTALMDSLDEDQKKEFVRSCPTHVYAYEEQHRVVVIEDAVACMFCEECLRKAELFEVNDLVSIGTKPGRFLFKVESTGVMPPEQIVFEALKIMQKQLDSLDEELNALGA